MIFRLKFLILISLITGTLNASSNFYQMMPGQYKLQLVLTDSEESYPVELSFYINNQGFIKKGNINYPTYGCKAIIKNSKQGKNRLTLFEEMTFGNDVCTDSKYDLLIDKNKLFSPYSSKYFTILTYYDGEKINIDVEKYKYSPAKYAKLRIKKKISNISEIRNSKSLIKKALKRYDSKILSSIQHKTIYKICNEKNYPTCISNNEFLKAINHSKTNKEITNVKEILKTLYLQKTNTFAKAQIKYNNINFKTRFLNLAQNGSPNEINEFINSKIFINNGQDYSKDMAVLTNRIYAIEKNEALASSNMEISKAFIKKYKNNNDVKKHLQSLYRKKGNSDKKSQFFTKAYKLFPNEKDVDSFIKYASFDELLVGYNNKVFFESNHKEYFKKIVIKTARELNSFIGYLEAYNITKEIPYIKQANKLAKTKNEKLKVEVALVTTIDPNRVFGIEVLDEKLGKDISGGLNLFVAGSSVKALDKLSIKYKLYPKKDAPLKVKYASYNVTVQATISYKMKITIDLIILGKQSEIKNKTTYASSRTLLSPDSWINEGEVVLKDVVQSISGNLLGIEMIKGELLDFRLTSLKITNISQNR